MMLLIEFTIFVIDLLKENYIKFVFYESQSKLCCLLYKNKKSKSH